MTKVPKNLISIALNTPQVPAAVVCADQNSILESVKEAVDIDLIKPILIGNMKNIYNWKRILLMRIIKKERL